MKIDYYNKIAKNISKTFFKDIDKDGYPNIIDCRPYNPRMQDSKPNLKMEEELKTLPIYFTASATPKEDFINYRERHLHHYSSKKMSKGAYKAKKRFQSSAKKYPDVIGEIKRNKPSFMVYTTKGLESDWKLGEVIGYSDSNEVIKPSEGTFVVVRATSLRGKSYGARAKSQTASTSIHELEHVRQGKAWEDRPKLIKRMKKGAYEKKPREKMAFKAEEKHKNKYERITYGARKKGVRGWMEDMFG